MTRAANAPDCVQAGLSCRQVTWWAATMLQQLTRPTAADGAAAPFVCRSEIVQLQAGAERQRRKRLSTAAVVGVTCCAALQVRPAATIYSSWLPQIRHCGEMLV
jgi:hypothetical protein